MNSTAGGGGGGGFTAGGFFLQFRNTSQVIPEVLSIWHISACEAAVSTKMIMVPLGLVNKAHHFANP